MRVDFPGVGRVWSLLVADKSAPIWVAVAQVMTEEGYLFRESAGGTYNCRPPSLHAYALALDLNPSKNPFRFPMTTDMPPVFIARMEGITANGKQALMWGGRFPDDNPPDPMHYQVNVAPADCKNIIIPPRPPNLEDNVLELTPASAREDIRKYQLKLNQTYNAGLTADGVWGDKTSAVVKTRLLPFTAADEDENASAEMKAGQVINAAMDLGLDRAWIETFTVNSTGSGITQAQADARFAAKSHPHSITIK